MPFQLRPVIDGPTATRLIADREQVRIDTSSLDIDAISFRAVHRRC